MGLFGPRAAVANCGAHIAAVNCKASVNRATLCVGINDYPRLGDYTLMWVAGELIGGHRVAAHATKSAL